MHSIMNVSDIYIVNANKNCLFEIKKKKKTHLTNRNNSTLFRSSSARQKMSHVNCDQYIFFILSLSFPLFCLSCFVPREKKKDEQG
jgi:hypothetical protein